MAETLTDFVESLGPCGEFTPGPIFQPEADLLTVFFEDEAHYAERVDRFLTVYKSFDDDHLVGFDLKGIRHKAEEMLRTLKPSQRARVKVDVKCEAPHINLLLTFYMKERLEQSRHEAYQSVYERAQAISGLVLPPELVG